MLIIREGTLLSSTWYNKPTDTGLIMNYHSLAPKRYKRSVVAGFVYRIHHACSSWKNFDDSIRRAKQILQKNQYPPDFYEPIIEKALNKIVGPGETREEAGEDHPTTEENNNITDEPTVPTLHKKRIFIEYRGKITEDYSRALRKTQAPCQPVLTLRKLKTVLPSLKSTIEKRVRSHVVYRIRCPRCNSCYIGQTNQYIDMRFKQHKKPSQPVGKHLRRCNALADITLNDVEFLAASTRGDQYLMTLEALWQREERPKINTKDEYKSRELTIMW